MANWQILDIRVGVVVAITLVSLGVKNFSIKLFMSFIISVVSYIE